MAHRARRWSSTAGTTLVLAVIGCRSPGPSPGADDETSDTSGGELGTETEGEGEPSQPLPPRPSTRSCRFDGWAPGLLPPLVLEPDAALPPVPGGRAMILGLSGTLVIGTDDGRLLRVDPADPEGAPFELRAGDGEPITGLALEPDPGEPQLFVRSEATMPTRTRVLRYRLSEEGLVPGSELEVIAIDHDPGARSGAGLTATAGELWIPVGDGAAGDDTGPAAEPSSRAGSLLRLDVSALAGYHDYQIPPDNPLVDGPGQSAEAWAWGLRDPAGCPIDEERGRVWCADPGATASEASLVSAGDDLGWPRLEGDACLLYGGCENLGTRLPAATFRHVEDDCGVGSAAIARGVDDELEGALVLADACSGRVLAVRPSDIETPGAQGLVGELERAVLAMAPDPEGGLWALDADGRLGHLVARRPEGEFPLVLSASGCFPAPDRPALDLVPYEINAPLWTDGSHKQRYLVLPPGERITVEPGGELRFPEGSVLLKTFSYASDPWTPEAVVPVETRVMIRRRHAWEFHTYAWDEDGSEARLLAEGDERALLTAVEGSPGVVVHTFPSRQECSYCHGTGEAAALGPRLDQLDRELGYGDQLAAMESIGLLEGPLPAVEPMADYRAPEVPVQERARAYLHANCGHCHRPGGWTPPPLDMDLRWSTALEDTRLCGVPPQYASTFTADYRVAPGDPNDSLVWQRLSSRGQWQMPPLATSVADPHAAVVREWIDGLEECPGG
ncbi:MAG: PQQ-dependent sugar dehydrogenase [Myxococcales bacterium]|nr:PQQ-dependent sugar dehydrogenase [Myxococcales bacterium]MCB9715108.1 PQQ-dependent sugar dehydrogenase [Myxococcales bacterium]